MSHQTPDFETKDVLGTTQHANSSVGLVSALIPAIAGSKISNILVRNPSTNDINTILYVALDAGTTYFSLKRGEFVVWTPKNNSSNMPINQIRVLGSVALTYYEIIMDFEP